MLETLIMLEYNFALYKDGSSFTPSTTTPAPGINIHQYGKIQIRRGDLTDFQSVIVLASGEPCYVIDDTRFVVMTVLMKCQTYQF